MSTAGTDPGRPGWPPPRHEVAGRATGLVRRALVTALFLRMDDPRATAALADDSRLVPDVVRVTRQVLGAVAAEVPFTADVGGEPGGPGLVVVRSRDGGRPVAVGLQVVGAADLLVRERVDVLPASRARFHADHGPDVPWHVLLAGDVTDHRVRQRVLSVHSRFAGSGALVVSPQYSAAFLRLTPEEVGALVARVRWAGDRAAGRPAPAPSRWPISPRPGGLPGDL